MRVVGLGTLPPAASAALARVASGGHELVLRAGANEETLAAAFDLAVIGAPDEGASAQMEATLHDLCTARSAAALVAVVGSGANAARWLGLGADVALDADEDETTLAARVGALASLAARVAAGQAADAPGSVTAFVERVTGEFDRAARYKRALALVVLASDAPCAPSEVLASFVAERIREVDARGPLPGERVGVLLPETDAAGALLAARRLLDALSDADLPARAGVAAYPSRGTDAPEKLIGRAFEALAEATRLGPRRALAFGAPDVVWAREAPDPWRV